MTTIKAIGAIAFGLSPFVGSLRPQLAHQRSRFISMVVQNP
jgi:hypothetical protein